MSHWTSTYAPSVDCFLTRAHGDPLTWELRIYLPLRDLPDESLLGRSFSVSQSKNRDFLFEEWSHLSSFFSANGLRCSISVYDNIEIHADDADCKCGDHYKKVRYFPDPPAHHDEEATPDED